MISLDHKSACNGTDYCILHGVEEFYDELKTQECTPTFSAIAFHREKNTKPIKGARCQFITLEPQFNMCTSLFIRYAILFCFI